MLGFNTQPRNFNRTPRLLAMVLLLSYRQYIYVRRLSSPSRINREQPRATRELSPLARYGRILSCNYYTV